MTDLLLDQVSTYGIIIILAATFLSCLAVPMPSSLIMLAGGAFIASGDLGASSVLLAAYGGAVIGDQTGYLIGRTGGGALVDRLSGEPRRQAMLTKAKSAIDRWGGASVFFSTWLFSPLGPYVNVIAGAAKLGWRRYTFWDMAGEAIWVTFYVGLGYLFSDRIAQVADIAANSIALVVAVLATAAIGIVLFRKIRHS
ncbi:DedA family protein [Fodinicurvata sp. EGI_FJ10296]|uniref:DedA family protein n=1 Tax=Fodinicurvata sp. EGI_FJ10296 TaxID=3231908 RepID=UPI0034518497